MVAPAVSLPTVCRWLEQRDGKTRHVSPRTPPRNALGFAVPHLHPVYDLRYIDSVILRDRDTTGNGVLDETLYYAQDARFNVTALVDTTGTVVELYAYTPYGERTVFTASWTALTASVFSNTVSYTGQRLDAESGLHHFRNRYYSADLGRFVRRWPSIELDHNQYQYQFSQAVTQVDPWGDPQPWNIGTDIYAWLSGEDPDEMRRATNDAINDAGQAVVDIEGHANWILTDDRNVEADILHASSASYIESLGINPFNTSQSLGQLLYTGSATASREVLEAAAKASSDYFGTCQRQEGETVTGCKGRLQALPWFESPKPLASLMSSVFGGNQPAQDAASQALNFQPVPTPMSPRDAGIYMAGGISAALSNPLVQRILEEGVRKQVAAHIASAISAVANSNNAGTPALTKAIVAMQERAASASAARAGAAWSGGWGTLRKFVSGAAKGLTVYAGTEIGGNLALKRLCDCCPGEKLKAPR